MSQLQALRFLLELLWTWKWTKDLLLIMSIYSIYVSYIGFVHVLWCVQIKLFVKNSVWFIACNIDAAWLLSLIDSVRAMKISIGIMLTNEYNAHDINSMPLTIHNRTWMYYRNLPDCCSSILFYHTMSHYQSKIRNIWIHRNASNNKLAHHLFHMKTHIITLVSDEYIIHQYISSHRTSFQFNFSAFIQLNTKL